MSKPHELQIVSRRNSNNQVRLYPNHTYSVEDSVGFIKSCSNRADAVKYARELRDRLLERKLHDDVTITFNE